MATETGQLKVRHFSIAHIIKEKFISLQHLLKKYINSHNQTHMLNT